MRDRGTDLRFGRRHVRKRTLRFANQPRDRRQAADRGHRRLYRHLRLGGVQRLSAAEDLPHLAETDGDLKPTRVNSDSSFRGAGEAREPGIHSHWRWLWIPALAAAAARPECRTEEVGRSELLLVRNVRL